MGRFREVADRLRHGFERADREALEGALREGASLDVPPGVRARLEGALQRVEAGEALEGIERPIAPLLDPAYPARALSLPTDRVPGVGPKTAQALSRRGLETVEDLLFFLPRSYEDRRRLLSIAELEVGRPASFSGTVTEARSVRPRRGHGFFQATVSDGTGAVALRWFRGVASFQERIKPGVRLLVSGHVRRYRYALELTHPEVEILTERAAGESHARIVARYPAVEGLPPRTLRRIVEGAVRHASDLYSSQLPGEVAERLGLPPVGEALRRVHLPTPDLDPEALAARRTDFHRRLAAEDLFLLQVGLALRHAQVSRRSTRPLAPGAPGVRRALEALPFQLTGDQRRAWREIADDLGRSSPMSRLLVGDVGTGKTVLAYLAAVAAREAGALACMAAPTEILARQHLATLSELGRPLGVRVHLLTGTTPPSERRQLGRILRAGEIDLLVGTHALLVEGLELPRLGLAIIDEQHRFGVEQRRALGLKGSSPHVLVMSATPIPRTLALTLWGDLDQSVLRERPAGRAPVRTRVVPRSEGRRVLAEVRRTVARGEQVFVVYPLVEESEKQDLLDATRGFERLGRALGSEQVALVHGRQDPAARARTMARFASGDISVLVATTVVEVGLDVPGATLLVVQHADRFGLAQLHQLRGRVGRGARPGLAILVADPTHEGAGERLAVLEATSSGFEIAEEDLRLRGAGEWLGTRQAGHLPDLRLAELLRHGELVSGLRDEARRLLSVDPGLAGHAGLREAVRRRWGHRLDLGSVA
ncbi:MAG: ATP-dependent DNA helicase RecG [Myxococcota bacterium]